jgi:hypothetical protein
MLQSGEVVGRWIAEAPRLGREVDGPAAVAAPASLSGEQSGLHALSLARVNEHRI